MCRCKRWRRRQALGEGAECVLRFAQLRVFVSCVMGLCSSISYVSIQRKNKARLRKEQPRDNFVIIRGKTPVGVGEAKPGTQSQSRLVQGDLTCQ